MTNAKVVSRAAAVAVGTLAVAVLAACTSRHQTARNPSPPARDGVDAPVTFSADGVEVFGSLRMPATTGRHPAALLIAGSGAVDRNGDVSSLPGTIGTLSHLADVLATHGVASLRYDKLGTGATGPGRFAGHETTVGFQDYVDEAEAGLRALSAQPGIDPSDLLLIGHSEGGLIAITVASQHDHRLPPVRGVAMLESPGQRYLDVLREQGHDAFAAGRSGALTALQLNRLDTALDDAVTELRATGALPADLPPAIQAMGLVAKNAHFLYQTDREDPVALATELPRGLPVLNSCSRKDVNVTCAEQARMLTHFAQHTRLQSVVLSTADHVLKDVGAVQSTGHEYGNPLPFDQQLASASPTGSTRSEAANKRCAVGADTRPCPALAYGGPGGLTSARWPARSDRPARPGPMCQ